ncbi:hypothetical protein RQP46_000384 [Phenoliferia psychrophenolica]
MNRLASHAKRFATAAASCAAPAGPSAAPRPPVRWTYLPSQLPYHLGLLLQETLVANRLDARKLLASDASSSLSGPDRARAQRRAETDVLLLLQHSPVYTAGRREKDPEVAKAEATRLGSLGADYVSTMRGGQTTYHGPGQLVGYSIMDIAAAQLSTRCYVNHLEVFLASLTSSLGVAVHPIEHTGVFVSPTSKIGSIGIHIRRRITLHGFSLNVEGRTLPWFGNIVACGLDDVSATCIEAELERTGGAKGGLKVEDVLSRAVEGFGKEYRREMVELGDGEEDQDLAAVVRDGVAGRLPPLDIA